MLHISAEAAPRAINSEDNSLQMINEGSSKILI